MGEYIGKSNLPYLLNKIKDKIESETEPLYLAIEELLEMIESSGGGSNTIYGSITSNNGQIDFTECNNCKYCKIYFAHSGNGCYDEIEIYARAENGADIYFGPSALTGSYIEYINGFLVAKDDNGSPQCSGAVGQLAGIEMHTYNQDEEYTIYYKIEK